MKKLAASFAALIVASFVAAKLIHKKTPSALEA